MWGTLLNAAGIVIGGAVGLTSRRQPSMTQQVALKGLLAALTVFVGLRLAWISLGSTVGQMGKQLLVVLLALIMGRVTGRLLHLQKLHNRLGRYARERLADTKPIGPQRFNEGFLVSTVLFCATPLGFLGAVQEGLGGHWGALGVKAVLEGLTAMSLVRTFGSSVLVSVAPVVAYQGTVTLGARWLWTLAPHPALVDAVNATGGLLVFSTALLLLSIRKIEVADYLPSLAFAPMLRWVLG
jgi:uncharacterized membrane protein YqgA involved in biofilm formation